MKGADEQLLRDAAKAAGLDIKNSICDWDDNVIAFRVSRGRGPKWRWNALHNPADAIEIAARFRFTIDFACSGASVVYTVDDEVNEVHVPATDAYKIEAMCRAILRAVIDMKEAKCRSTLK